MMMSDETNSDDYCKGSCHKQKEKCVCEKTGMSDDSSRDQSEKESVNCDENADCDYLLQFVYI